MTTFKFQQRNDTAANWTSNNPTLLAAEIGYETDSGKLKFGNGTTAWTSLAYYSAPATFKYGRYTLSVTQTANLANGNPVKFDTVQGSLGSLSSYGVALTGGKTYKITFGVYCSFTSFGYSDFRIYDTTNSVQVGDLLEPLAEGRASNDSAPRVQEAIYIAPNNCTVQLQIVSPSSLAQVNAGRGTRMFIEEYAGV